MLFFKKQIMCLGTVLAGKKEQVFAMLLVLQAFQEYFIYT